MRAKKSLGQHFLRSEKALASITRAGDLKASDTILEIGPGEGALTQKLLETGAKVIAVEKDDSLYRTLEEKFKNEISSGKLLLVHNDILDFNLSSLEVNDYKLIANIPYNITGTVFKKFLETDYQPKRMVLLVQKEVAERIIARDGKESVLSISIKAYGTPRYVEMVRAGSFIPMPKVDSAIISIENISKNFFGEFPEEQFFKILKAGFKSKRKKLSSNLATLFQKKVVLDTFEKLNLNENIRAEDVSIDMWKELARLIISNNKIK